MEGKEGSLNIRLDIGAAQVLQQLNHDGEPLQPVLGKAGLKPPQFVNHPTRGAGQHLLRLRLFRGGGQ